MTIDRATPEGHSSLRCEHCGRLVHETRHTRTTYRVDYYAMHTGETDAATISRSDKDEVIHYLKLIRPVDLVSCVDCYGQPAVRQEREQLFRPERTPFETAAEKMRPPQGER